MYLAIEIYPPVEELGLRALVPTHNVIATPEEMAEHMQDFRGHVHVITGFYTAEQVADMSLTDRGFAYLDVLEGN